MLTFALLAKSIVTETRKESAKRLCQRLGHPAKSVSFPVAQQRLDALKRVSNACNVLGDVRVSYRILIAENRSPVDWIGSVRFDASITIVEVRCSGLPAYSLVAIFVFFLNQLDRPRKGVE